MWTVIEIYQHSYHITILLIDMNDQVIVEF